MKIYIPLVLFSDQCSRIRAAAAGRIRNVWELRAYYAESAASAGPLALPNRVGSSWIKMPGLNRI